MSSIFARVLNAFKLNRFQPDFKYLDHPECHKRHKSKSGMPIIMRNLSMTIEMFSMFNIRHQLIKPAV